LPVKPFALGRGKTPSPSAGGTWLT